MKYELQKYLLDIPAGTIYENIETMFGDTWITEDGEVCQAWLSEFLTYHVATDKYGHVLALVEPEAVEVPKVAENGLNSLQNAHKKEILKLARTKINEKYTAGALEHQTNLKDDTTVEQLLEFAIEEATDQMVYLLTMQQKMEE